jgi:predicted nucleic acid-binding protein
MIKQLFFDTDCFSSFLWVKQENILLSLYHGRIVLPQEVYIELSNPSIPHIKSKVADLCANADITTQQILINTEEYNLFHEMALSRLKGEMIIGKGEAAALALAKVYHGIIASNNLKDIGKYIKKYELDHITTGEILISALNAGLIDEKTGNQIWSNMLLKRRLLPTSSFSDYLKMV